MRRVVPAVLAAGLLVLLSVVGATPASAAGQVIGHVAYVTGGNVWYDGLQLTHDGNDDWPRVRPGGDVVVYNHGTQLWVVATTAGATPHLLVNTGIIGRPAWSPDGSKLAYVDSTGWINVADYAGGALSGAHQVVWATNFIYLGTGWVPQMVRTAAVAWSPDGRYLAHTGGDNCLALQDYCLSLYDTVTGADEEVAAFGGSGGNNTEGFANIPAFSADSTRLYWTTQHDDPDHGVYTEGPVHVVSCGVDQLRCSYATQVQAGVDGDSVPSPSPLTNTSTLLVTGGHNGQAWVTRVRADGTRTYLYQGYGQDWIA